MIVLMRRGQSAHIDCIAVHEAALALTYVCCQTEPARMSGASRMDSTYLPKLIALLATFAASVVLTPIVRATARRLGVFAFPDPVRRFHAAPVPMWGGVAVYLAMLVGLAIALTCRGRTTGRFAICALP